MIELLSGALIFAYAIAGIHFLHFWRRTGDRLFGHFAVAFWLFALNQLIVSIPMVAEETGSFVYLLRILGFAVIVVSIVDKNTARSQR